MFGLCLGASIISLIEVIYFAIVHIFAQTMICGIPKRLHLKNELKSMEFDAQAHESETHHHHKEIEINGSLFTYQYME